MKLIPAGGSPRMQRALSHGYVRTIIHIMLQHRSLWKVVARLLRKYERYSQSGFVEALESLRLNQSYLNAAEDTLTPPYIIELTQTLHHLYQQPNEDIKYLRGAIVELFTYELVRPRYKPGECLSNQRFLDERGRAITDQVDVAALSREKFQVEGYECKLKVDGIESSDCTNLVYLTDAAQERSYYTNVGIISFDDSSRYMQRKLARLQPDARIQLYGLDSIALLELSPF